MKKRKWILQEHKPDADWAVLENVVHQDEIMRLSTVEYARSAEAFGADYIPVGDAPFIAGWLKKNYEKDMEPIEVPECLRKREFLKRRYYFAEKRDLPFYSRQKYFIKNISVMKGFSSARYNGAVPGWDELPDGRYLVSEWLDILSEFRIFVYHDQVIAIQPYLGMPLMFPDGGKIHKMVDEYKKDSGRPRAYTMDIGVSRDKDGVVHTVLIKVHPFVSYRLYGFCLPDIPDMLEEGIRYYTRQREDWEIEKAADN